MSARSEATRSFLRWHLPIRYGTAVQLIDQATAPLLGRITVLEAARKPAPRRARPALVPAVPFTPPEAEPRWAAAAAWLWLRIHVLWWRDTWPVVTTRERRNNEVARALQASGEWRDTLRRLGERRDVTAAGTKCNVRDLGADRGNGGRPRPAGGR